MQTFIASLTTISNCCLSSLFWVCVLLPCSFLLGIHPAQGNVDLSITGIQVNSACQIVLSFSNTGTSPLPASAYDQYLGVAVSMSKDGSPFGGWRLAVVDPQQKLKNPQGSVVWTRTEPRLEGSASIGAKLVLGNALADTNAGNNNIVKPLSCNPPIADLALQSISFLENCQAELKIANIGDGNLQSSLYSGNNTYVQRLIDGTPNGQIRFSTLDSNRRLQAAGGNTTYVDTVDQRGQNTIEYQLNGAGQEKSTANNRIVATIPQRCKVATSSTNIDLAVTLVGINQDCEIIVEVQNAGSTALPDSIYDERLGASLAFKKDGQSFGGYRLAVVDSNHLLRSPGGRTTFTRSGFKLDGSATVNAYIQGASTLDNNTGNDQRSAQLTCAARLPDLQMKSVTFTDSCQAKLEIVNVGSGKLPDNAFSSLGAYVQRWLDDAPTGQIMLNQLDPSHKLIQPGGRIEWLDSQQNRAQKNVRYEIRRLGQEQNVQNNGLQASLRASCQPTHTTLPKQKAPIKLRKPVQRPLPKPPSLQPSR